MRNRAEWHKRAGECAQAGHEMDYAAHEYFQASLFFLEEGKRREAMEMRRREQFALSKTIRLLDSARSLAAQGQSLAARASMVARQSGCDSDRDEFHRRDGRARWHADGRGHVQLHHHGDGHGGRDWLAGVRGGDQCGDRGQSRDAAAASRSGDQSPGP